MLLLPIVLIAGFRWSPQTIDAEMLKGAWWKEGEPSFTWLIKDRTILTEFDMKEHPYRIEGDILIIDFQDPALGVQRKTILRLTADELEFRDEESGGTEVLHKMKGSFYVPLPVWRSSTEPNVSIADRGSRLFVAAAT